MEFEDISSTGFIPKHLLKILTVIENEELRLSWKLIRNSTSFTLIVNGLASGNGQTSPSKEPASGGKVVSRNINRPKHHHAAADTRLAEQPKRKKKKSPAPVARDRERRKAYWKHIKVAKKLRAENLAAYHAQLQETRTLASPQTSEDSHPENTGCMELVSVVSESHRHLTIESGTVKTACVQLDSSELSAEEVESEKSNNSSLDSDDDPDAFEMPGICTTCGLSPPEVTLQKCSLCKLSKYCSKQCQKINWREHKFACSIVADSVLQSGRSVLLSVIASLCRRAEKVHVICYDRDPGYVHEVVPQELSKRLIVHDGFHDVLGWNNPENLSVNTDLVQYLENKPGCHSNHNVAIVIDSLSPMMLHRSAPYTCGVISKLSSSKLHTADMEQVVCLIHGDLHDNHSLTLVEHLATTVVKVMPSALDHFLMATNILHKRISGKIIKAKEHFNLSETYEIQDVTEIKTVEETTINTDTGQVDPTSNLTFNLTLSDKEKEARSQVKLPYTYDKDRQDDTLNKSVGEGKIFYQPDEADDFDEEDPDDDLDI